MTGATGGGNVTFVGLPTLTVRGVTYGLAPNPTTGNTRIINGIIGAGSFTSSITGLTPNTTYFIKAYATSSSGTSYGNQVTFTTLPLPNINLPLVRTFHSGTGPGQQSGGSIIPSPPLSAGQCITANFNICHVVFCGNPVGGNNLTTVHCCAGGVNTLIGSYTTGTPSSGPPNRCLHQYTISVTICHNEYLTYTNQVASGGASGTCSCLSISSVSSSPNITVNPSVCDCLVI